MSSWRSDWSAARRLIPETRELEGPGGRSLCDHLIGSVREARRKLLPTPTEALDQTVQDWIHAAEDLGVDCPGGQGDADSLANALLEIETLDAEIEAALAVQENHASLRPDSP